jgi:hypothetical protein
VQPIVAAERPVFYREVASGMYSQLPFAVAQVRGTLPYLYSLTTEAHQLRLELAVIRRMLIASVHCRVKFCGWRLEHVEPMAMTR